MSAGCPYKWTGTIAFVRGVIACSIKSTSIRKSDGLQSTSTGSAPVYAIARAVATKVLAAVITSSPGPMLSPRKRQMQRFCPVADTDPVPSTTEPYANECSNAATWSPKMYCGGGGGHRRSLVRRQRKSPAERSANYTSNQQMESS